ncbi:glutamate--tRNA ligase [Aquimarina agarivorans]|uniref:glutamate--tRNA ligase n=1 Tax=Aquimarina agarivorans TaxID=980584 RepID=UPI000248F2B7|nr:glutamate--tRNA ligase [Aquimarina agarivorans]
MSTPVRVRFAPSPTGPLHIGGLRTALYNYLFAKKHQGTFVLRIEDTDQTRFVEGAENYIKEALDWCGISYDEGPDKNEKFGPYRQSERKSLYRKYAEDLIAKGAAYYAFDTADELDFHRKDHEAKGKTFIYNWHNRLKLENSLSLSAEETKAKIKAGDAYVIRFKTPEGETLEMHDEIRGDISINTNVLDDKVLFKSDGMPTYHLANIVDDHLMEITHVIRGEEWLPSMPLHILLYKAFDWKAPKFAHLSLLLKPVGKGKLSKRDGDKLGFPVFPLNWTDPKTNEVSSGYREAGFYPETVVNFLALLGWNPGTEQEIFSLAELIEDFDLKRVNKSGAKFDPEKNKWFQQQYLQQQTDADLAKAFESILTDKGITTSLPLEKIVSMLKERAVFPADLYDLGKFFFKAPTEYDKKAAKKAWKEGTAELMQELVEKIKSIADFSAANATAEIKAWITSKEIGFGKVMMPLRLALVGSLMGPDVYEIAAMLGRNETINRLENAIKNL